MLTMLIGRPQYGQMLYTEDPLPVGIALGKSVADEDLAYAQFVEVMEGSADAEPISDSGGSISDDMFESMSIALSMANACLQRFSAHLFSEPSCTKWYCSRVLRDRRGHGLSVRRRSRRWWTYPRFQRIHLWGHVRVDVKRSGSC